MDYKNCSNSTLVRGGDDTADFGFCFRGVLLDAMTNLAYTPRDMFASPLMGGVD